MELKTLEESRMYFIKPVPQYVADIPNGPLGPSEEDDPTQQANKSPPDKFIAVQIMIYVSPVLLSTGTLGSLFSICVLLRPNIRKSTPMYFLTLLSFTDVAVLWLGLLRVYASYVYGYELRGASDLVCKLHTFFVYFTLDLSSWLLALIAIERFLVIVCPPTVKLRWNRTKGTYAVIVVAIILTLVNGHYMFTNALQLPLSVPGNNHSATNRTWVTDDSSVTNTSIPIVNETVTNLTHSINAVEDTYVNKFPGIDFTAPISVWFLNGSKTATAGYNELDNSGVRVGPNDDEGLVCRSKPESEHFHSVIFPWIDFVAFFFLPFCIMVITHIWIIRHVHLVNVRLRKPPQTAEKLGRKVTGCPTSKAIQFISKEEPTLQCISTAGPTLQGIFTDGQAAKTAEATIDIDEANSTLDVPKDRKKRKAITRKKTQRSKVAGVSLMLISVLVTFAITTLPITFYLIISLLQSPTERHDLVWVIVNIIQYSNNVSHFFLFILTSKNFRQELLKMFSEFCVSCKKFRNACKRRPNTIEHLGNHNI